MKDGHEIEIVGSIYIPEESSRGITEIINTLIEIREKWEDVYSEDWDELRTSIRTSNDSFGGCVIVFDAVRDLSIEKQIIKTKEEVVRLTLAGQSVSKALKLKSMQLQDLVNQKQRSKKNG